MSDIWSNVGVEMQPRQGDWLYRKGTEIHGPIPKQAIVDKLLRGDVNLKTLVAREGGEFHPIGQVAAFAEHIEQASKVLKVRTAKRTRNILLLVFAFLLAGGGAAGWYFWQQAERKKAMDNEIAKLEAERLAVEQAEIKKFLEEHGDVEAVALVSLGDVSDMKMGGGGGRPATSSGKGTKGGKGGKGGKSGTSGSGGGGDEFVSSCQRKPQEIFAVLGRHLRTINVCVQDEKSRDTQGLLPKTLILSFVALPSGKVSDFAIKDRHFRTGPMKNCMVKAFRLIKFPSAGGSNCPVDIPIKIGG